MARAPRPLPPVTRRLVGWLLVLAGVMLALGVLLQIGIAVYLTEERYAGVLSWPRLSTLALGLVVAIVLVYYGRLMRKPE